ncbi:hypothetical protein BOTBODRAFT_54195 [Botryobasidium botryosum FD-172 SS1]|uniref:Uncharacterized protein n=1 Tax=Botryobasidium botryosum (strain FD-172 SS1) TaxID=930990 RepID=A0A067MWX2_BOTB1|nr:hypothetical protein BOTBODRAFT_54195 [Botryobasidium botryosum FD-172 SS1]
MSPLTTRDDSPNQVPDRNIAYMVFVIIAFLLLITGLWYIAKWLPCSRARTTNTPSSVSALGSAAARGATQSQTNAPIPLSSVGPGRSWASSSFITFEEPLPVYSKEDHGRASAK